MNTMRITLEDLAPLPSSQELAQETVLVQGHTANLHREVRADIRGRRYLVRFWVSRMTLADDETHRVHVEALYWPEHRARIIAHDGSWRNVGMYEPLN